MPMTRIALFLKKYQKQNLPGMRNKKLWLIIKGILIGLFTYIIFAYPVQDSFRNWIRFIMLAIFVSSFIIDAMRLQKKND